MICPIQSAGYGVSDMARQIECGEGRCVLWDSTERVCEIIHLVSALRGIERGIKALNKPPAPIRGLE